MSVHEALPETGTAARSGEDTVAFDRVARARRPRQVDQQIRHRRRREDHAVTARSQFGSLLLQSQLLRLLARDCGQVGAQGVAAPPG